MSKENKRSNSNNQNSNSNIIEPNLNNSNYLNNINPIQNTIPNSLINKPFLKAQISQNISHQIFIPPTNEVNPFGSYESYQTNLIYKNRIQMKRNDIDLEDIIEEKDETKSNKNNKKETKNKTESTKEKKIVILNLNIIGNKYLYSFHNLSNDRTYYELRCKDKQILARYIIESGEIYIIKITQLINMKSIFTFKN